MRHIAGLRADKSTSCRPSNNRTVHVAGSRTVKLTSCKSSNNRTVHVAGSRTVKLTSCRSSNNRTVHVAGSRAVKSTSCRPNNNRTVTRDHLAKELNYSLCVCIDKLQHAIMYKHVIQQMFTPVPGLFPAPQS